LITGINGFVESYLVGLERGNAEKLAIVGKLFEYIREVLKEKKYFEIGNKKRACQSFS